MVKKPFPIKPLPWISLESALNNPQAFLFSDCSGVTFCKKFWAISLFCYKMSVCSLTKNNTPLLTYFKFWNDSIVTDFETHDKLKYLFKPCLKKFLYIPLHKIRWHRTRDLRTDVQQRLDCLLKYFFPWNYLKTTLFFYNQICQYIELNYIAHIQISQKRIYLTYKICT